MLKTNVATNNFIKPNLSFLHLQTELIRIDILILRAVRYWQQAHQNRDTDGFFQGHYISDAEINTLLQQPLGANWWQGPLPAEGTHEDILEQVVQRINTQRQTAQQQGDFLRLDHLRSIFGLSQFEQDALLICLAPALDRRYERLYGYLQDDATRRWPGINLILDLLCEPGPARLQQLACFAEDAPLFRYHLLTPIHEPGLVEPSLLNQALRPDQTIVAWFLGRYQPHHKLHLSANLLEPQNSETDKLLAENVLDAFEQEDFEVPKKPFTFVFYGLDKLGQRAAARQLAKKANQPLLMVNLAKVTEAGLTRLEAMELARRDAQLNGAILFLEWDSYLQDDAPPRDLLLQLCTYPGWVIVASSEKWQARGINREHRLVWLHFPTPSATQRRALWTHFLGQLEDGEELELDNLVSQFSLSSGQIRDAVAATQDTVFQRGTPLQNADLFAAARAYSNPRLAKLADKIEPRYSWQDLILPSDQITLLRELVATVHGRPKVLEEWKLGSKLTSSAGITVLFTGPPGTGKTMAAEVLARELGLDLYKLDLSTVVSKYIGETEKNLSRIFKEAENSNAILFFDEADALFGKRSEVRDSHDRYANIEISYLLQRMEAYDGLAILATNLRANLDEAFTRRLQFVVDFPFPEEEYRERIWQTLFPANAPHQEDINFVLLARRFKLAGGSIRNIIMSAAYLAAAGEGQITMDHLLHGARREMQKMGRLTGDKDFEPMNHPTNGKSLR